MPTAVILLPSTTVLDAMFSTIGFSYKCSVIHFYTTDCWEGYFWQKQSRCRQENNMENPFLDYESHVVSEHHWVKQKPI